jgi:hypothetical protein
VLPALEDLDLTHAPVTRGALARVLAARGAVLRAGAYTRSHFRST